MIKEQSNNISDRINFIKNLLNQKMLDCMIDLDSGCTENFENKNLISDCRELLNKKTLDFNKLIKNIGGKLLYIKSGTTGHTFKGIIYDNDNETEIMNYAVKVVAYPIRDNYGNIADTKRPENAELMMIKLLSYFVINEQTPHLLLPIGTFYTKIKPFIELAKNKIIVNKKYDQFVKRYKQNEYYKEVSILMTEWANGGDLLDYFRNNYKTMKLLTWKIIFFQLISVLCIIQNKYPDFRHNDLKANNILVQKIDLETTKKNFLYKIKDSNNNYHNFCIPNIGIQIKICDFDFACVPNIVENSKVSSEWTDQINVKPQRNKYYDLHYFFNTFTHKGFFPEFWQAKEIHKSIKQFVKDIIPDKYSTYDEKKKDNLITEKGRILVDDEYTTPEKILINHEFFERMKEK